MNPTKLHREIFEKLKQGDVLVYYRIWGGYACELRKGREVWEGRIKVSVSTFSAMNKRGMLSLHGKLREGFKEEEYFTFNPYYQSSK